LGIELPVRSGELPPALESHLSKYRSLIPSLALLIHLAEGARGLVGIGSLQRAIRWGVYLETHARRLYAQATDPGEFAAQALGKRIVKGDVTDGFSARDVYRRGWSGLLSPADVHTTIARLVEAGWLVEDRRPTDGRTGRVHFINPRLAGSVAAKNVITPTGGTARTDGSLHAGASGGSVSDLFDNPPQNSGDELPGGHQ
jgi:hypothetical protein